MTTAPRTMDSTRLVEGYETMYRIRCFESAVSDAYRAQMIHGFVHSSAGGEASAVGVCLALGPDDYLTSTHRGHGHCIARGMRTDRMAAELYGRVDGYCGGRGGSMHVADPSVGLLGANGIVGSGIGIAVGAGLVAQLRLRGVAVAFFGDGATTTGYFHESVNLAAVWGLPVLFVCENNGYVEFTPWSEVSRIERAADLAAGYGIEGIFADGTDLEAVYTTAVGLVDRLRSGEGPFLLELSTVRIGGHYEGDAQPYRSDDVFARDPIPRLRASLVERGIVGVEELVLVEYRIHAEIEAAFAFASASPYPDPSEVGAHV